MYKRQWLSLLLTVALTLSLWSAELLGQAVKVANATYNVPAPSPPASNYEIGAISWPLWKQGEHLGWDLIAPYASERKPLGVGWYDQNDPEVWSWFNRWALNYGIKFWSFGWYRNENGPVTSAEGEYSINAFKQAQFSNQMKYTIHIHNRNDADAAEIENHIYPYLKTHFEDSRYLIKNNKPVVFLLKDGLEFDMDKLRELALDDGWDGVYIYEANGAAGSDGKAVYNDMLAGSGWGAGHGVAVISQGWSPEPWGRTNPQGFRTVAEFEQSLQDAKSWMDSQPVDSPARTIALVGTWDELGEGHFVMPTGLAGFGYLNAIRKTFTSGGSLPGDTLPAAPIEQRYTNPAAYYKLDETTGTTAADDSIFQHHATNYGAAWQPAGGKIGGALQFDGIDDYVLLAGASASGDTFMHERVGSRTVSFWFKADTTSGDRVLYDEGDQRFGMAVRIRDGKLEAAVSNGTVQHIIGRKTFTDTSGWHLVHLAYAGQTWWNGDWRHGLMELYVDGVLQGSEIISGRRIIQQHEDAAALGARKGGDAFGKAGDGGYFQGKIDEVRITYRYEPPADAIRPDAIILDNGQPGYAESGTWANSGLTGYNGSNTRFGNSPGASAMWTPDLAAGKYDVSIYKIVDPLSDSNTKIDIVHAGGTTTLYQDWTNGTSGWTYLGTFNFDAGASGYVQITRNSSGAVRADAVKFEPIHDTIVIDHDDPEYAESGDWQDSSIVGWNGTGTRFSYTPGAYAQWTPDLYAGTFAVSVFKAVHPSSDSNAKIEVVHAGGTSTFYQDWTTGVSGWETLGTFRFNAGTGGYVRVSRNSAAPVRADAARFEPVVYIDNGDPGYAESGTWQDSGLTGSNGSSTRFGNSPGAFAEWTPHLTEGTYKVSIYKIVNANSESNTKIEVVHAGGTSTFYQDWTTGVSGWEALGSFDFQTGTGGYVRITRNTSAAVRADAVLFERERDSRFEMVVDNTSVSTASVGAWTPSSALPNRFGADYAVIASGGSGQNEFVWIKPMKEGVYDISVWLPAGSPANATNAKYTVYHDRQTTIYNIDQTAAGGQWVYLGTHYMSAEEIDNGMVKLTDEGDNQYVVADAVKFAER